LKRAEEYTKTFAEKRQELKQKIERENKKIASKTSPK
jgi:hypothetical protein